VLVGLLLDLVTAVFPGEGGLLFVTVKIWVISDKVKFCLRDLMFSALGLLVELISILLVEKCVLLVPKVTVLVTNEDV